jgi:hypothetical protein
VKSHSSRTRTVSFALLLSVLMVAGLFAASPAQAQTTFSGRAFAASVSTALTGPVPIVISDTGQLSPSGGSRDDALLDTRDPNLATLNSVLTAEVLRASTSGASGKAESSASLANVVVVLPGTGVQVTASFLGAQTEATCSGVSGSSEIADLKVGDASIPVTGAPNQTVTLPGGAKLIINEQTTNENGTFHQVQVNALHLIVPGVAEVILSSAESDINCAGPAGQGPCHDFVTGGGWIKPTESSRANFGFHAGFKAGSSTPDVHLNYIDHGTGMKVKATSIDVYRPTSTTSRHFEGYAEVNGVGGYRYTVDVADNGEPGQDDTFFIRLEGGGSVYSPGGTLQGGNIQLHKPCL